MTISVISASDLTDDLRANWRRLQCSNPDLTSPFFSVEFAEAVASVRADVWVAIIEDGAETLGFFPFQLGAFGIGEPIGGILSDYHGIVAAQKFYVDPAQLLRACGLVAWDFNHLPASQLTFRGGCRSEATSPAIDISDGYAAYLAQKREAGTQQVTQCVRKARKLESEIGSLRFETHTTERCVLEQLMHWKSNQYVMTDVKDIFAVKWVRRVIQAIYQTQAQTFGGVLSALYAGESLTAVHFGMRSSAVWHYWFPAYDPKFAQYSPGLLLLLKMAESAPSLDLKTIDLGKGGHRYKQQLMNTEFALREGAVERPSVVTHARNMRRRAEAWIRGTKVIYSPLRWCFRRRQSAVKKLTKE